MPDPTITPLAQQIDDAIAVNRAATPSRAMTQRRVPRVSIAELNAMDREQLGERLRKAIDHADDRSPVTTVLDLIDLPRNVIANIVAPSLAAKKAMAGDTGTFGLGKVYVSDMLKEMGVENGVVRGVAGFIGDVALDPLTYAGPGAFVRVGTRAGEAAVTKTFAKKLAAETARVAEGGAIADDTIGTAIRAAVGSDERLAKLRAYAEKRAAAGQGAAKDKLGEMIATSVQGRPTMGRFGRGLSRVGIIDPATSGGVLSHLGTDLAHATPKEVAKAQAAKDVFKEFGVGRGIQLGEDATSQIAHIPFTDIGINVPPITQQAKKVRELLALARDAQTGADVMSRVDQPTRAAYNAAKIADEMVNAVPEEFAAHRAVAEPVAQDVANLSRQLEVLRGETPEALGTRHAVHQAPISMADQKRIVAAIDPGAVEGEAGAGISKATIDQKLDYLVNGPTPTGRGAFLTDSRAEWLADPDNGTRAIQAHAYRQFRSGDHVIAQHGPIVGLDPQRLSVGDQWNLGHDTFTVMDKAEDGTLTLSWQAKQNKGTVDAGERIVRVGPKTKSLDGTAEFDRMLPANEHSFVGTLPTMRDPNELTGPHRARVASQLTEAFGDKASNSLPVMDAYAKGWARAQGKTVEDFYKTLRIEKGGKPGEGALFDIPAWHDDKTRQVHTPAFKSWFGNSKVVDEHGKPLVVYHGTAHDVTHFDITKFGQRDDGWYGKGFYFTPDAEMASNYAESTERATAGHNVVPAYVSLKNPYVWPDGRMVPYNADMRRALHKELANAGHDGVIVPVHGEPGKIHEVVAFSSEQVKSATGNIGTFDPKNPDIRFQRGGAKGMGKPRGSYEMLDNGERVIRALTDPNASTLPHEVAHDFYNLLPQMDPKLAEKAAKAVGAESHAASTVQHQENFARGFEDYLRTGNAPSRELKTVFENFKQWLVDIYRSIVGTPLEGKMNPELKAVFDEMLTKDKGPVLSLDPESLKLRDTLVARQAELTKLRAEHAERLDIISATAERAAEVAQAALSKADPGRFGGTYGPQDLITLTNLSNRARAEAKLAAAEAEQIRLGMGIRSDIIAAYDDAGLKAEAAEKVLSEAQKDLYYRISRDPEEAGMLADIIQKKVDANVSLAKALNSPVQAVMTAEDRVLAGLAKSALGFGDDKVGLTVFGSMARMAQELTSDDSDIAKFFQSVDRHYVRLFGNRSGTDHRTFKEMKAALTGQQHMQQEAAEGASHLYAALKQKYGANAHKYLDQANALLNVEIHRLRAGDSGAYPLTRFGTNEPSRMGEILNEALAKGIYSGQNGAQLQAAIKAEAKRIVDKLDAIGDVEVADRMLGIRKPQYVPKTLTSAGEEEMRRVANIRQDTLGLGKPRAKEPFQIQSLTDQTHYPDPETGKLRRFFESERELAEGVSDAAWKRWKASGADIPQEMLDFTAAMDPRGVPDPARARTLMEIVDDVKTYENLPAELKIEAKHYPTDIYELEELRGTRLWPLTGGKDIQFWQDSVPMTMARRVASHERAWAMKMKDEMLASAGMEINRLSAANLQPGSKTTLKNGVEVTVLQNDAKGVAVRAGDTVFRTIDVGVMPEKNALEEMIGSKLENWLVHETTATRIEDMLKVAKDPEPLLKMLDKGTAVWRAATLTNFSWIVNNFIGNSWLALSAGADPATYARNMAAATKLRWYRHNPDIVKDIKFTLKDGRTITGDQLIADMERGGHWDKSFLSHETMMALGTGAAELEASRIYSPGTLAGAKYAAQDLRGIPADMAKKYRELADMGRNGISPNFSAKNAAQAGVSVLTDKYMKLFGAPFAKMNSAADDVNKALLYLSFVENGYTAEKASERVTRSLFDFADLTHFEQEYMRRIIPFYSWIRSSTSFGVRQLLEDPKWAAMAPKLREALEEALAGEQALPQNLRPSWMREQLAVQVGSDPEKRQALMLMSGLPVEQLYHFLTPIVGEEGLQDFVKYYGNASHPFAKAAFGLTAGVDPFSGKSIGPDGDMTAGQFLAAQVRPFNELGLATGSQGKLQRAYEQGGVPGLASRFFLGGKFQDFSQERVDQWNARDFKKKESSLRIKITRAQNAGEDTLELRANLLALYHQMQQRGLPIPVWAQEELSGAMAAPGR